MSDAAEVVLTSNAPPKVQQRAEQMGWIPPTRYKGDVERFVDADAYIERGETVLPIVKQQNKQLKAELEAVRIQSKAQADALAKAQAAIDQIEERHSVETQKAVERAKEQVKAQLAAASEAGDHEGVAALTDKLVELRTASAPPPAKKQVETKVEPEQFTPPADLVEWIGENQWFQVDRKKTALALAVAQELREGGDQSTGRTFYDKVALEVNKVFEPEAAAASKVEGARNGDGAVRSGAKTYAALPADAKEACDKDIRKFVGPGKKYKSEAEWRNRYAELYFQS